MPGGELMRRWLGLALAAVVLTGCAETVSGTPTGASADQSGAGETEARPQNLTLDGLKACVLLTQSQRAELGVDAGRDIDSPVTAWDTVPSCQLYQEATQAFYNIYLDGYPGLSYWTDILNRRVTSSRIDVSGFPAVQYFDKEASDSCGVAVSVADKQQLNAVFSRRTNKSITQDQMCQNATKAATMALGTLKTVR